MGKLDVVDAAENPLSAGVELVVETVLVDSGAVALPISRLVVRFSFCKLKISRRTTFQE